MSRRASLLLLALAVLAAPEHARAQLPFPMPFGGDAPKKEKKGGDAEKDAERSPDASGEVDPDKPYTRPEPRPLPEGPATTLAGPVLRLEFKGIVNPGMGEFVASALSRAERERFQAVLIELDTPGGLVSTTETIVQNLLGAKVPVIVYVSPSGAHAASAGTFITLAAHVAAMAPATRLGAAHPVTGSGGDPEAEGGKHMGRKVENDLVAFVEGIARERNRNVEWAIDAVRSSVSINADRALEIGVVDLVARDRTELLDALEGRQLMVGGQKVELHTKGATLVEHELSIREWLVNTLANPGVAVLLGLLGLIGIMVEIYHPGMIAPGVMGVLCLICSLIAVEQLPIDLGGALLIIAGIGLLIAELYAPAYGMLGVLGAIGLTVGLLLLVDTTDPSYLIDDSTKLGPADVAPIVVLLAGFVLYLSVFIVRRKRGRPITGSEALIGLAGIALKPVSASGGTVFVSGEYWRARSSEVIAEKEEIEVVKVDGLELEVRPKRGGSPG